MAKIEFSEEELQILKEAAEAFHRGGAEKARTVMNEKGLEIEFSPEMEPLMTAEDQGDGCYACIACLFIAVVIAVAHSK